MDKVSRIQLNYSHQLRLRGNNMRWCQVTRSQRVTAGCEHAEWSKSGTQSPASPSPWPRPFLWSLGSPAGTAEQASLSQSLANNNMLNSPPGTAIYKHLCVWSKLSPNGGVGFSPQDRVQARGTLVPNSGEDTFKEIVLPSPFSFTGPKGWVNKDLQRPHS